MARLPHNLERNPIRRATWIGYDGDGRAFRVRKVGGRYLAAPSHAASLFDGRRFTGATLAAIGAALEASRGQVPASGDAA